MPQASQQNRSDRERRKERVLHTRISDTLAEDIRRIADDLRVPVSNLVRNVLEEVFDVVETVSDDAGDLFGEILDEAEGVRERVAGQRRSRRRRSAAERSAVDEEIAAAERGSGGPPPPPIAWHCVEEGRAAGPFPTHELLDRARSGRLTAETLVWCAGMSDWRAAGDVPALASLLRPPPIPQAPSS